MRNALALTALAGCGLALAACSGSSQPGAAPSRSAASPSVTSASPSGPSTSSGAPSTVASSPAPTATGSTAAANCPDGSIGASVGNSTGAAGHIQLVFVLRNTSSATCRLFGYPGMQMLNRGGHPIATRVVRGGGVSFPDTPPKGVVLAPGATASFDAEYTDVPTGSESCPQATAVEVTPPNDRKFVVVRVRMAPCDGGTIHVSPVVAGSSGLQQ